MHQSQDCGTPYGTAFQRASATSQGQSSATVRISTAGARRAWKSTIGNVSKIKYTSVFSYVESKLKPSQDKKTYMKPGSRP